MELARYLVDAVVLEKRSYRDVARSHGVSKSWVAALVARFREGGYEAVAPRSRAAKNVANRSPAELEVGPTTSAPTTPSSGSMLKSTRSWMSP